MATTRIKDLSKTATTVNSDANLVLDGNTGGTQKISRDNFRQDTADAFVAAPGTYNLAPLNSGTGKIDAVYLSSTSDSPKGAWDASSNTPTLADGSGTAGDYYDVTVAGSSDLGSGSIAFTVGDVVKYNGTVWFKIDSVANILDGVSTIDGAKTAIEIPDVGTGPSQVPLNQHLGTMAYQSSDGVSVGTLEVTDKVDGSLGIGVTPDKPLHVGGSGEQTLRLENTSDGLGDGSVVGSIEFEANDSSTNGSGVVSKIQAESLNATGNLFGLSFHTGHGGSMTEKMVIDNNGHVGIGTAAPGSVTDISGSSASGRGLRITETSASKSNGNYTFEVDSSAHGSNVSAAGAMKIDVASGRAMTVDGLGKVGVGTATPGSKLHVFNSTADNLRLERDATNDWRIQLTGGALAFRDATADVERWRIDSSGNLVANGTAIDFGSTNTNTGVTVTGSVMSEYEQGTFTPKLADAATGGNVATYSTNAGDYIRVGNQVFFALRLIDINTAGLPYPGNTIYITDMPYQCKSGSSFVPCNVMADSLTFTGQVTATLQGGVSYLILKEFSSGGADASLTVSAISSGVTDLFITGSYLVA